MASDLEYLEQAVAEAKGRHGGMPSEAPLRQLDSALSSMWPKRPSWRGRRHGYRPLMEIGDTSCGDFHSALFIESKNLEFSSWQSRMVAAVPALGSIEREVTSNMRWSRRHCRTRRVAAQR